MKQLWSFLSEQVDWSNAKTAFIWSSVFTPFLTLVMDGIIDFYKPVYPMIVFTAIIGISDFITGIWASRVEGVEIVSDKMFRRKGTVLALFMIVLTCMLAMDRMLQEAHSAIPAFLMILWMVFYTFYELFSMLENVARIRPDLPVKRFVDLIKRKAPEPLREVVEAAEKDKPDEKPPTQ